jgi:hypothetical protein
MIMMIQKENTVTQCRKCLHAGGADSAASTGDQDVPAHVIILFSSDFIHYTT